METLNAWLLTAMSSGWGLWVLAAAAFLDALIVPIPTELAVLACAAAFRAHGSPQPLALMLVCAVAFAAGDIATYWLGALAPVSRFEGLWGGRARPVVGWARQALLSRGGLFTVASRFVPAGRTVMNLAAGSVHYPLIRYAWLSLAAGFAWSAYMWTLGYVAAAWLRNNPLAVMAVGGVTGGGSAGTSGADPDAGVAVPS